MKSKSFFTNKYLIGIGILLICLLADIILHLGMSRVMLPENFTSARAAFAPAYCEQPLVINEKRWVKAVNTLTKIQQIDRDAAGIEMDVYFDVRVQHFYVYHDSSSISTLEIGTMLDQYAARQLKASIWLDFKNLSDSNQQAALRLLQSLRSKYDLHNKMIIESSAIKNLSVFCNEGFYTSFYVPYFNPYKMELEAMNAQIDAIANLLKKYPVSALSGYYFQIPLLSKYFPTAALLTWAEADRFSLISPIFNASLLAQKQVKVVLY